ncbi:hypothetical protein KKA14_00925, partial [bacterium]|nr:hypothetical protein [bacterium]
VANAVTLDDSNEQIITAGNSLTLGGLFTMSGGQLTSSGGTLTFASATITGGTLDIRGTTVIENNNISLPLPNLTSDSSSDWTLAGAAILSLTGSSGSIDGSLTIPTGTTIQTNLSGTAKIESNIVMNGGTLDVVGDTTITSSGNMTHTASSFINIAAGKTLSYAGNTLVLNGADLTVTGANTGSSFSSTYPVTLNHGDSSLILNGSGDLNQVSVTAASNLGKGIIVNGGAFVIVDLFISASPRVNVASGSLTIGNNVRVTSAATLIRTGAGTFTIHDLLLSADFAINGTIALSTDSSLIVLASSTFSPGGDLTFKDGLQVASGALLLIEDGSGTYTLTIEGGAEILGAVQIGGNETLVFQYPIPDTATLANVTEVGSGTVIPISPITNFSATGGNTQVSLNWSNPSFKSVLIRRSSVGYPLFPTNGTQIYDGSSDSVNDNGLSNGVTYYYAAFTHTDASTDYAPGEFAFATTIDATPDYNNDITNFTAVPGNGYISLSWDSTTDTAGVRIMRDTDTYPDSTTDGELVYNSNDTSTDDKGVNNSTGYKGLLNGRLYYYRAYAYNASGEYAPGVNAVASTATISSGLVSYYPFSGNTSDGSGQGNHGEVFGDADLTSDIFGTASQAYTFDGAGDYIEIENPVEDDFSISFWFRSTQVSGASGGNWFAGEGLVEGKTGTDQSDFGISLGDGNVMFGTGNTNSTIESSADYNDGNWYHVTATRSKGMGDLSLYIQGTEIVTGTGNVLSLNAPQLLRIASAPGSSTNYYQGDIDDIRIYNRVLNQTEIERLYFLTLGKVESTISSSDNHSCLLLNVSDSSNDLKCWGNTGTTEGRLGNGSTAGITDQPVEVSGITNAIQVSTAHNHSCAVLSDGTIKCWGEGTYGKLGNNSTITQTTPVTVNGINNAVQVATGSEHSCAVLDNGIGFSVKCWGNNTSGQLGIGNNTGSYSTPQLLSLSSSYSPVQVDTGLDFSCALLSNRKVVCWGDGTNGKLGNGSETSANSPVFVDQSKIYTAVQISVGRTHSCALLADQTIKCWGEGNANARMGNGTASATNHTPVAVTGISNAIQVMAGYAHTCALLADQSVKCWGNNDSSQLGESGATNPANSPVVATNVSGNVTNLSLGMASTCATFSDGTAKCWGKGSNGELGNDATADSNLPVSVYGLDNNAKQQ